MARRTLAALTLSTVVTGCTADVVDAVDVSGQAASTGAAAVVPETAPSQAIVLANESAFPGINELHYPLLRGLFKDAALLDVKVHYLTPLGFDRITTPVLKSNGSPGMAVFAGAFANEIQSGRLTRVHSDVDVAWARDFFPLVVKGPEPTNRTIQFEYRNVNQEGQPSVAGRSGEQAARALGYAVERSRLELEGGNVLVDDDKTLFTTTKLLERNKPKTKSAIETALKGAMGVTEIVWLDPLPGESTGHIDIFAKVVGRKKVVVQDTDAFCPPDAPPSCEQRKPALDKVARTFAARGYQVTRILSAEDGKDIRTLTYTNSLLVNGTVFIPAYFEASNADLLTSMDAPGVPAKKIVRDCNAANPFPGTTEAAAEATANERARCALEGVGAAMSSRDPAIAASYAYAVRIAHRDAEARKVYESLGFRVVPIASAGMINLGGSVHCMTMQVAK